MKNIGKIIKVSRPLYKILGLIAFLIVLSALLELASPILSKLIVDNIVAQTASRTGNLSNLIFLIAITFLANFLGVVVSALSDRMGDHFAGEQRKLLTEKFYTKVLALPQSYFDSEISGKIVNQLSRGIFTIQNFTNAATNFILPSFLQSILTVIILAQYSIPIALFMFIL